MGHHNFVNFVSGSISDLGKQTSCKMAHFACTIFSGYVALIIDSDNDAEIYSPEGKCNYKLRDTPFRARNPVLFYANRRIIACALMSSCWEYNITGNSWQEFTQANFRPEGQPGVVIDNNLYIIDTSKGQVLNLISNTWSPWQMPPKNFGPYHSMVGWKDSIILMGGENNYRGVQIFNVTGKTWTVQNSSNAPMDMSGSSSLLIDEDEILIAGSNAAPGSGSLAAKYNPATNTWVMLEDSEENHSGSQLVKLGSRVFSINGNDRKDVEEFLRKNNSWTAIEKKVEHWYTGYHSAVALPSSLFAHLPQGCEGIL